MTKFNPGPGRDITDVSFTGLVADFRAECKFEKDLSAVDIRMSIVFQLSRGAGIRDRQVDFSYYVAMPYFHPKPEGKRVFVKKSEFQGNRARLGLIEEVRLTIPLARNVKHDEYRIFLGFQLSEEQVRYNRSQIR